jgi:hypothetical protein
VAQLIYVWQGIHDPVLAQQILDQVVTCAHAAYLHLDEAGETGAG